MHSFHVHCPWSLSRAGEVRISRRHYLPEAELLPADEANLRARAHPAGVAYRAPAGARALAHAVERPGSVISAHGALALHGLPYLVEGHDTVLIAPTASTKTGELHSPTIVRRGVDPSDILRFRINGFPFHITTPAAATIFIIKPLDDAIALQFIDCVRRFLGVAPQDLLTAGSARINRQRLTRLIALSSDRADSPKETERRLLTTAVAERRGVTVTEQHPIESAGRLVTVLDLALLEPRVGLMYDGKHHWDYQQRQKDSLINLEAAAQGWTKLRFSAATLPELPARLTRLLQSKGWGP